MTDQAAPNAEELRLALNARYPIGRKTVEAAARSWLALLEGDEAMVEKVALRIHEVGLPGLRHRRPWHQLDVLYKDHLRAKARAVIAAITEGQP